MTSNSSSPQQSLSFAEAGQSVCLSTLQHSPVGSIPAAFLPGENLAFSPGNVDAHNCCPPSAVTNTGSEVKQAHPELQFYVEMLVMLY